MIDWNMYSPNPQPKIKPLAYNPSQSPDLATVVHGVLHIPVDSLKFIGSDRMRDRGRFQWVVELFQCHAGFDGVGYDLPLFERNVFDELNGPVVGVGVLANEEFGRVRKFYRAGGCPVCSAGLFLVMDIYYDLYH